MKNACKAAGILASVFLWLACPAGAVSAAAQVEGVPDDPAPAEAPVSPDDRTPAGVVDRPHDPAADDPARHAAFGADSLDDPAETRYAEEIRQAREAVDKGEWRTAIRLLDSVIRLEPDNLEARYLRGIAHREDSRGISLHAAAVEDLQFVAEHDLLFENVLYELALAFSYRRQYPDDLTHAVWLAEQQVSLKPGSDETELGLFDVYRTFTQNTGRERALSWLRERGTPHARFFRAELLRKAGELQEADRILAELMQPRLMGGRMGIPVQPVLLARARVHYAMGRPERAQPFVVEAIRSINGESAARFLFEDFKYVFDPGELDAFESLRDPEEFQTFFVRFWDRRDPMPASAVNMRLAEHYRRLAYAERYYVYTGVRAWVNDAVSTRPIGADEAVDASIGGPPGEIGSRVVARRFDASDFPPTHTLASEFDDRGILFVRHGEPAERAVQAGFVNAESWRYEGPEMHFHFASSDGGRGVDNFRLRPTPHESFVGSDGPVAFWSSDYRGLRWDWLAVEDAVVSAAQVYVDRGLTTDRHSWSGDAVSIEIPHMPAAFRGPDGRTTLDVIYALPFGEMSRELDPNDTLATEIGLAFHDGDWNRVGTFTDTKRETAVRTRDLGGVDFFRVHVEPGSYRVALHARSLSTPHVGGYRFEMTVPDLSGPELQLSTLVPAYEIGPARSGSTLNRGDVEVLVNPQGSFPVDRSVYVYFEVYNLTVDTDDRPRYRVAYTLRSLEEAGRGILDLLRRAPEDVVVTLEVQGSSESIHPVEYAAIDVRDVPPGEYDLEVTITDENSGQSAVQSTRLTLTK